MAGTYGDGVQRFSSIAKPTLGIVVLFLLSMTLSAQNSSIS
jgi:hypothetical protein